LKSLRFPLATLTCLAAVVGFGGAVGVAFGVISAVGVAAVLGRDRPPEQAGIDEVAVVAELIAGCLAAGLSMPDALIAAADAGDSVTSRSCHATASALRQGVPSDEAWRPWLDDPWLSVIARTTVRTTQTGAAAADSLRRSALRLRAKRRAVVRRRVHQTSVWVVVPLGLCFLPAFVCVAVVPTVIGLFPTLH
jgi:type II secretion system (T2SS) protein F